MCLENLQPLFEARMHSPSCYTLVLRVLHDGDIVQVLLLTAELQLHTAASALPPKNCLSVF